MRIQKQVLGVLPLVALACISGCVKKKGNADMSSSQNQEVFTKDFVDSLKTHPKTVQGDSIPLAKVPMFICFGFDDNGIADKANNGAATWIYNVLHSRTNNAGSNNPKTFDGLPMRASFYLTAKYGLEEVYEDSTEVREIWNKLYLDGNEIGNHSTRHAMLWDEVNEQEIVFDVSKYSVEDWLTKEIDSCQTMLTNPYSKTANSNYGVGMKASEIYGWRTPRLEWNDNVLTAISQRGFIYDCSIQSDPANDGKSNFWPFTLDNGHPLYPSVTKHPGLWETHASRFNIPESLQAKTGKKVMTGLDYDAWVRKDWGGEMELTGPEFCEILKHTLDLRMQGNRAPMMVGLHSDIYTNLHDKNEEYPKTVNAEARQKAIEDFIDYASKTYPEVRIVRTIDVINWMKDPVGL